MIAVLLQLQQEDTNGFHFVFHLETSADEIKQDETVRAWSTQGGEENPQRGPVVKPGKHGLRWEYVIELGLKET